MRPCVCFCLSIATLIILCFVFWCDLHVRLCEFVKMYYHFCRMTDFTKSGENLTPPAHSDPVIQVVIDRWAMLMMNSTRTCEHFWRVPRSIHGTDGKEVTTGRPPGAGGGATDRGERRRVEDRVGIFCSSRYLGRCSGRKDTNSAWQQQQQQAQHSSNTYHHTGGMEVWTPCFSSKTQRPSPLQPCCFPRSLSRFPLPLLLFFFLLLGVPPPPPPPFFLLTLIRNFKLTSSPSLA